MNYSITTPLTFDSLSFAQLQDLNSIYSRFIDIPLSDVEDALTCTRAALTDGETDHLSIAALLKIIGDQISNIRADVGMLCGSIYSEKAGERLKLAAEATAIHDIMITDINLRDYERSTQSEAARKIGEARRAALKRPLQEAAMKLTALAAMPEPTRYRLQRISANAKPAEGAEQATSGTAEAGSA